MVTDAQQIPFRDDYLDLVIGESILAFIEDKSRAAREFFRVTRSGGFVGITEATWLEKPPLELVSSLSQVFGPGFAVLRVDGWKRVLSE